MNRIICLLIPSLIIISLLGCATYPTSSYVYMPPNEVKYDNEAFVDKPFEVVWDELVEQLSKSFYVINNIEKASRIINVSFSTDTPEEYVDCGISTREYGVKSNMSTYTYKVAETSFYKSASRAGASSQFPVDQNVNRETSLEGRANIFVAPEGNGTKITINCRYVFSAKATVSYETRNVFGTVIQRGILTPSSTEVVFNTNQEKKTNWGTPSEPFFVTCHSTGELEQGILNLVKH